MDQIERQNAEVVFPRQDAICEALARAADARAAADHAAADQWLGAALRLLDGEVILHQRV